MPIANMRTLMSEARKEGRAVGAFSVSGIEMIVGVLRAAETLGTPVILQVAEKRLSTTPLAIIGKAMLAAAAQSSVEVAVHLDHGESIDCVRQALDIGFTSVMYDGSMLSMEQNIQRTLEVQALARLTGASVEAEIGRIGKTETGEDSPAVCARPDDCVYFYEHTHVDALAVAIGNAHGVYVGTPQLRFDVLSEVERRLGVPLVLHGGTGISNEDFRRCISIGVAKINIATALFQAAAQAAASSDGKDYFAMSGSIEDAVAAAALPLIRMFGVHRQAQEAIM